MSVGSTLSAARVSAGLTIDDIADRTRIRRTLIENIEADDFHACGGDFYARAHVKSIAQALHLDPAPLLAEFDGEHHNPDLPTAVGILDPVATSGADRGSGGGRSPNWTAAMAAALAAVVAFGAFQLVSSNDDGSGRDVTAQIAQTPTEATQAPSDEPTSSSDDEGDVGSTTAPSDAIAQVPERGVTVVLRADGGRSWISATGKDGDVLYQSVLDEGGQETLTDDRQVKLVVGNAGAVSLVVNGQDLGSPGGEGEVVRLTFGPGDPSSGNG